MKLTADRAFADPEKAARRLLEHAHAFEPIQDGRIYIEKLNGPFLYVDRGSPAEYSAGLKLAIERGWLELHDSGTYVKFTAAGADSVRLMARDGWQRTFRGSDTYRTGGHSHALRDAAAYITGLPKERTDLALWQAAIEALILVARSGSGLANSESDALAIMIPTYKYVSRHTRSGVSTSAIELARRSIEETAAEQGITDPELIRICTSGIEIVVREIVSCGSRTGGHA